MPHFHPSQTQALTHKHSHTHTHTHTYTHTQQWTHWHTLFKRATRKKFGKG